jgi:hypothetical protein
MKRDMIIAASLFVLVGLGSWAAKSFGFYSEYWFTDVILHALAGLAFGFIWTGLTAKTARSKVVIIVGAAGLAVLGSVLWEVWEYAGWQIIPGKMRAYVPELGDSLADILCGLLGGLAAGLLKANRK